MLERKIIKTEDGSHTIVIPQLNEQYHSLKGATLEALHVYIQAGLANVNPDLKEINILEFGFGTGLNALLSYDYNKDKNSILKYTCLEKYPLQKQEINALNYKDNNPHFFAELHDTPWEIPTNIKDNFILHKIKTDFLDFPKYNHKKYDLIYFDAFAPSIQPGLWTDEIFQNIASIMNPNAIFVTYSAKGSVRRAFKNLGFNVERIPGALGKLHMLRATKIEEHEI